MSKLQVLGRNNSINVMKVMWCAEELGLPVERKDIGGAFGGNDQPDYLAINPNGRVPTIVDDGFVLWESNVCVRYLCDKFGNPGLFPADKKSRWLAEQWMDWQQTTCNPTLGIVFWGLVRTAPEQRNLAAIETARKEVAEIWARLDAHLAGNAYVGGEAFTMGDIPAGCSVHRWYALEIERPSLPNLEAWYGRLKQRSAYQTHAMLPLT